MTEQRTFTRYNAWTGETVRYRLVRETARTVWGIPLDAPPDMEPYRFNKAGSSFGGAIRFDESTEGD